MRGEEANLPSSHFTNPTAAANDDADYVIERTAEGGKVIAGTIPRCTLFSTAGSRNYAAADGNGCRDPLNDLPSALGTPHGVFAAVATVAATAVDDNYPSLDRYTTLTPGIRLALESST